MIALIDSGGGNLHSVEKALQRLGAEVHQTSDPAVMARADKLVLPGVGAFQACMRGLEERGLVEPLRQAVAAHKPLLGICVGMQVLFEEGLEDGVHPGLGFLPGRVVKFRGAGLRIPHTGWNQLWPRNPSALMEGVAPGSYVYFNHSYYCQAPPQVVVAATDYGRAFASMVARDRLYGIQFHPEKSQRQGLHLLKNFLERA